jgi:hypothetical protein
VLANPACAIVTGWLCCCALRTRPFATRSVRAATRTGAFGRALEPDIRAPESEPSATLHALEVFAEISALDDPMVDDAAAWTASIADPDGGVPFSLRLP